MAGPIIFANISVPLLGAVDTAVVGHLPEIHYIGAVAIGAMLFNYIYDGIYLAATRTRIMRNTVVTSFLAYLVLVYALMPLYGNTGLWIAVATFLGLRGLLLHLYFPRLLKSI